MRNNMYRNLRRLYRLAKISGAGVHSLRHTFASINLQAGIPLVQVSQWLGHQDIQTTMIYSHCVKGAMEICPISFKI